MTLGEFKRSLQQDRPPAGTTQLLEAMWNDARGDWKKAHEIAQEIENKDGAWVHAYLHRKEGDAQNASYWYQRAGKPVPSTSLEEEWESIVGALLL